MQCPACQHENREAAKFCEECGRRFSGRCPSCGFDVAPSANFCPECGQRLAVDEDGRVLVWTGGASMPPESIASLPLHQEGPQAVPPRRASSPPAARPADAERRQLTVLICDLADSTVLAHQPHPEELPQIVRAYQDACAKVIAL